MQNVSVVIDVFRLGRVVLNHAILTVPEQTFNETHFSPRRAARDLLICSNPNLIWQPMSDQVGTVRFVRWVQLIDAIRYIFIVR